jgi:hypothetical protein
MHHPDSREMFGAALISRELNLQVGCGRATTRRKVVGQRAAHTVPVRKNDRSCDRRGSVKKLLEGGCKSDIRYFSELSVFCSMFSSIYLNSNRSVVF